MPSMLAKICPSCIFSLCRFFSSESVYSIGPSSYRLLHKNIAFSLSPSQSLNFNLSLQLPLTWLAHTHTFLSPSPLLESLLIMHAAIKFKWDRFLNTPVKSERTLSLSPYILLHPGPSLSSLPTNRCPGNCNVLETYMRYRGSEETVEKERVCDQEKPHRVSHVFIMTEEWHNEGQFIHWTHWCIISVGTE